MSNDDFRVRFGFLDHYKTDDLRDQCGDGDMVLGDHAVVCFQRLWEFCGKQPNRRDGNLHGMTDRQIELQSKWSRDQGVFVRALVNCGFLDGDENEREIHDWEEHQSWLAGYEKRSQAARTGGEASVKARKKKKRSKRKPGKNQEKQTTERSVNEALTDAQRGGNGSERKPNGFEPPSLPSPSFPDPTQPNPSQPNPTLFSASAARTGEDPPDEDDEAERPERPGGSDYAADARAVVDHFLQKFPNRRVKTGVNASRNGAYKKVIARLKEGFTADELKQAIEGNANDQWHRQHSKHELDYICQSENRVNMFLNKRQVQVRAATKQGHAETPRGVGPGHPSFVPRTQEENEAHYQALKRGEGIRRD